MCFEDIETVFDYLNYRPSDENMELALRFFSEERSYVRNQFENLSWHVSADKQFEAVDFLSQNLDPSEYIFLVLADRYSLCYVNHERRYFKHATDKTMWENAAKTIKKIGWPKIQDIVIPMFYWLLDPNWPGSDIIKEVILSLPSNAFSESVKAILENPNHYSAVDYMDLKDVIDDLIDGMDRL